MGVGRTVAHVMGHAPCPVIVVPPDWEPAEDEASRGVLVGVDGSVEAVGAIAFGADVADRSRSTLVTASVSPRLGGPDEETRRRYLAEAVAGHRHDTPGRGRPGGGPAGCAERGAPRRGPVAA